MASGTYRVGERTLGRIITWPPGQTKRPTGGSGEPASFEIVGDRRNWWQQCTCCLRDRREIVTTAALDLRRQLVGSDGNVLWLLLLVLTGGTAGSDRQQR